ncbi:hypothetical protein GCM10025859_23190 [Alicyclobacillus fastidiosus]|nr:hypothetical protein GCM10025859_23190 [Alicyclobacillus fastidiosus]
MRIVMKIGGALDGRGNEALRATLGQAREGGHEVILVHGEDLRSRGSWQRRASICRLSTGCE